ncbi:cytoplasmic polyadenylation element-binding protein 3 isoform X3 [Hyla sarda]|uniref:cytoplasmic polyadenylation element-binding protein 3 isoform X3 n=1 Tax=Hyla sarda TaxID=327740 RepID=UPI0024C2A7C3|nr:cytoplasmic polyadenylation element-binding protein 3 isoform X3 [Hyla sarda]
MQDDLLMDKSQSQQRQQSAPTSQAQQQDPNTSEAPCAAEPPSPENNNSSTPTLKEKIQMESPILPGLSFPQPGQQEPPTGPSLSPSFGSTWSTGGTSNAVDDSFFQGITPVNGTMLFQNFPHHHVNPVFGGTFSPQLGLAHQTHQQQQRRSPVSPNNHPPYNQRNAYSHQAILTNKPSTSSSSPSPSSWNNQQNAAWNNPSNPWGGLQPGRDPRRAVGVGVGVGVGVPSPLNPISPMKKPFSSNVIAPPKFPRASPLGPKSWVEDNAFRTDNGNNLLPLQDRNRPYESFNLHSLENSLMDMIRTDHEPLKARMGINFHHPATDNIMALNNEITASFRRFGPLVVDWPHKAESKSYFPPKGYAFLLFQEESSVQALIDACLEEDGKLYLCVSSPTIKDKPVQIRPWNLSDSDFVMDGSQPLDPRKTIFVGGVPRPLRAVELAMIMDRLYGGVCYAGIDTDPELKYPKGAGRVAFSNQQSYIAAISARFVQLQHNDIDKRVEVKPYVLDDQMCDECQGTRCGGKFAPFFCANVTCLQYYCEYCWASIHSRAGREFHKPLVKEGGDRPRHVPFRWS